MTGTLLITLFLPVATDDFSLRCAELAGERGAVGVMELQTGRLIVATNPELLFSERFPPGSVAKVLIAHVAVEKGIELPDEFTCPGREISGKDTLVCSRSDGHGVLDFDEAFEVSCNLYFQNLAKSLTAEELAHLPRVLKLDRRVGIDLAGEVESIIETPSTDSAKLAFAVGQGSSIQLTPVAMLCLASGLATGRELLRPHVAPGQPVVLSAFPGQKALARIRPLLRRVVREGTGKPADITTVEVAGKTGTSTVLGSWITQGWFIGFAPYERPEIAVVVYLKRGEGKDAARIAGLLFSDYFSGKYARR